MAKKRITTEIKIASYASLLQESDKGCLLLAVGIFDKVLQNILETAILSNFNGKTPKKFVDDALFGDNGTLHSFSSKINIAYAFCLISKSEFSALHVLRKLRNEAAHCYFEFSFRNPGVVAHMNKLEDYDLEINRRLFRELEKVTASETDTEKYDFIVRCYALVMDLEGSLLKQVARYATDVRGIKLSHDAAPGAAASTHGNTQRPCSHDGRDVTAR